MRARDTTAVLSIVVQQLAASTGLSELSTEEPSFQTWIGGHLKPKNQRALKYVAETKWFASSTQNGIEITIKK